MTASSSRFGPLHGVRVLELATVIAAPSASRLLCAYGAEVIKIEAPGGDDLRYVGSFYDTPYGDFQNPTFTAQNSNKRLVCLNLKSESGIAVFLQLLEGTDVFVTNMRQEALSRLGIAYSQLKTHFPRLIYAHLTSFGSEGPVSGAPGYDVTAFWARTGCFSDWPEESGVPFSPTYGFGDNAAGMTLFSGILMALFGREHTGKGTLVSSSLFGSGIWYNANGLVLSQFLKRPLNRDLTSPASMFATIYQCSDGRWISLYASNYRLAFPKFARAMGFDDMLEDPRFQTYEEMHRSGANEEAVERCRRVFLTKSASEWKAYLTKNDIACEIAFQTRALCTDEQALANGYVRSVSFDGNLQVSMAFPPVSFSAYSQREIAPCGAIGQDTVSVLQELGISEEEILHLKEQGAVQ